MNDDTSGVKILPPLLYGAALIVGFLLHVMLPIRFATGPPAILALRVAGAILVLVAVALAIAARARFTRAGTNVNPMLPTTALVLEGPYKFTRNPMYLGLTMLVTGVALFSNAVWMLVVLIPTVFVLQREVIAKEERYLEAKFGDEYRAYRSRVRRWL